MEGINFNNRLPLPFLNYMPFVVIMASAGEFKCCYALAEMNYLWLLGNLFQFFMISSSTDTFQISLKQGIIKYHGGEFFLWNFGKRPIYIDGHPVIQGNKIFKTNIFNYFLSFICIRYSFIEHLHKQKMLIFQIDSYIMCSFSFAGCHSKLHHHCVMEICSLKFIFLINKNMTEGKTNDNKG